MTSKTGNRLFVIGRRPQNNSEIWEEKIRRNNEGRKEETKKERKRESKKEREKKKPSEPETILSFVAE